MNNGKYSICNYFLWLVDKMTVILRLFIFQMWCYNKNQFEDGKKIYLLQPKNKNRKIQ